MKNQNSVTARDVKKKKKKQKKKKLNTSRIVRHRGKTWKDAAALHLDSLWSID